MAEKNIGAFGHFLIWFLIVPPGMIFLLITQMPEELNFAYLLLFFVFAAITVLLQVSKNGPSISIIMWITMPAFLMYGLAIEVVVMQLSVVAVLMLTNSAKRNFKSFFANSTLMFILSIVSAGAFYVVGGQIGSMDFWPIVVSAAVYRLVHTTANIALVKLYLTFQTVHMPYLKKDILRQYSSFVLIVPLVLTFYFLLNIIGIVTFLLIGLPFFTTIKILDLYGQSEKVNNLIEKAGTIGSGLSRITEVEKVTAEFIKKSSELFNADTVLLFKSHENWLELDVYYENGKLVNREFGTIRNGEGIAGMVFESNEPIIFRTRSEWQEIATQFAPVEIESILCIPLSNNNSTEGILLLASKRKFAFGDYHLKVLDILGSYYIVSLEKACYLQEAQMKSERCALTKLYNFRSLEERLHAEMRKLALDANKNLSLVMLDIDHFKAVNDAYGHQSGNDILCELSRILESELPEGCIVGRYGGEEFVYLLPNFTKAEALNFAAQIRSRIKEHPFTIIPDLSVDKQQIQVFITASIGVSNAPLDTDEAIGLLRNADRALYIGAKQAGRDRVAEYVK